MRRSVGQVLPPIFVVLAVALGSRSLAALRSANHRFSLTLSAESFPISGNHQSGIPELETQINRANDSGDIRSAASDLNRVGLLFADDARFADAQSLFAKSLALYRQLGNREMEATVLSEIAITQSSLGQFNKSLDSHKKALRVWRELANREQEAATLGKIGEVFRMLKDFKEAQHFNQLALPIYLEIGNRSGQAAVLNNMGLASFGDGDRRKAIKFFNRARDSYYALGNKRNEAISTHNLAVAYFAMGDRKRARSFFDQALLIRRSLGDRTAKVSTLISSGLTCAELGNAQILQECDTEFPTGDRQQKYQQLREPH